MALDKYYWLYHCTVSVYGMMPGIIIFDMMNSHYMCAQNFIYSVLSSSNLSSPFLQYISL